jgi:hypothetical protein
VSDQGEVSGSLADPPGTEGTGWLAQFRRSTVWADAEYPNGYTIELPGRHAWLTSTPAEREAALDSLFYAYWLLIHQEDTERRLERDVEDSTSYLSASDTAVLWDCVHGSATDQEEIPAYRQSLINVLCELELLQHRITCLERSDAMDAPESDDSGESK